MVASWWKSEALSRKLAWVGKHELPSASCCSRLLNWQTADWWIKGGVGLYHSDWYRHILVLVGRRVSNDLQCICFSVIWRNSHLVFSGENIMFMTDNYSNLPQKSFLVFFFFFNQCFLSDQQITAQYNSFPVLFNHLDFSTGQQKKPKQFAVQRSCM